ncbi:MAG: tyrosine-type recombinase/integrase [Actinomycetota bacterium]
MERQVNGFLKYLAIEKSSSQNTIIKYRADLNRLQIYLREKLNIENPGSVTISHLRQYIEFTKDKYNLSPTTIANKIAVIKSFFKYLYEQGAIAFNPAGRLRMPRRHKKIPRFLNDIELDKLLSAPDRIKESRCKKFIIRDKLILSLFAYSGLRKSELLNLDWDDINLGAKYLVVRNGKNKTDCLIPLHDKLYNLLEEYLSQRLPLNCSALIIGEQGKRLAKNSLNFLFKKYIKLSGLSSKKYTIHTLRHTFATRLLNKNVSLIKIKDLLGHRSVESTEIYLHATKKDLADSVNLL